MDTSSLIVAVMPIMTLIALFTGIALPFAGSRSGRSHAGRPLARADALKRIGAARRKARPPEPGANDAAPAGYLYVPCARIRYHGYPAGTCRWVQQVQIVKKTAKLIYYTSDSWDPREAIVSPGCISREQFETDTRCHDNCPRDIAAGPVCTPHGRGHRHCVHFLAPGRRCDAPGGCGQDCPADTRGVRCARHGYTWEHCPHGEDRCRHGYPAGVIPIPGDRQRPGPAGYSSPPARPPKTTCTAGNASEPNRPRRKHHSSRSCAARWPTLTPTVAARLSSSSKRAAGTRRRLGPRDGNVLTWPAPGTHDGASRGTDDGPPAQGCPPVTGWDHAAVGRRTTSTAQEMTADVAIGPDTMHARCTVRGEGPRNAAAGRLTGRS